MKRNNRISFLQLCLAFYLCTTVALLGAPWDPVAEFNGAVIPRPNHIEVHGEAIALPSAILMRVQDPKAQTTATFLSQALADRAITCEQESETQQESPFIIDFTNTEITEEGYKLNITSKGISVQASSPAGFFYGAQTLLQLMFKAKGQQNVGCVEIVDQPRFAWRGFMLDESRHFFGKDEVKKILDIMAYHKMNRFHWHLTDEPGWRIEIKKYPKLTSVGAIGDLSDPKAPAQFYTQEEIKEIVAYAAARHIEVIPEIDMPGHATAANKAYPEHSGGISTKRPHFTFNPGREETYEFLEDILKEVAALFPSQWIHYGGDETHFGNACWKTNKDVIRLMQKKELKNILEVEHYFNRRMADVIHRLGKTVMGWDEIVGARVPKEKSMVMWWRHNKPQSLDTAIDKGYKVILSPRLPCYFDFVQHESHSVGRRWKKHFSPLHKVYEYPVLSASYTKTQGQQIMGIQACCWTETIKTTKRLEFMVFPRLAAISEAAWTEPQQKDFSNFQHRLKTVLCEYERRGIHYFNSFAPESTPEPKQ